MTRSGIWPAMIKTQIIIIKPRNSQEKSEKISTVFVFYNGLSLGIQLRLETRLKFNLINLNSRNVRGST